MKKRITCMLLVLCMVLAAVPTALAGQAVEDQLDFSLLKKHQANETQTLQVESVQKLQEEAVEPMDARASGYATYVPHSSSLEQYRMRLSSRIGIWSCMPERNLPRRAMLEAVGVLLTLELATIPFPSM